MEFEEFCILASKFLVEEEEEQTSEEFLRKELKEAFKFYDKQGIYTTQNILNIDNRNVILHSSGSLI